MTEESRTTSLVPVVDIPAEHLPLRPFPQRRRLALPLTFEPLAFELPLAARSLLELAPEVVTLGGDAVEAILQLGDPGLGLEADVKDRSPNNSLYFPERPSGMHLETFTEHLQAVREAQDEWHEAMETRTREFVDGFGVFDARL